MDGLVFTIDKLGRALAQAEQDNAALKQENALLRERLESVTAEQPSDEPPPTV